MSEERNAFAGQISKLARAAGIRRLFWVDDKFGQRDLQRFARLIGTKIEVFWTLAPKNQLPHPRLKEIPVGSNPQVVEGRVLNILQQMRDQEESPQGILENLEQQICELDEAYPSPIKDLSIAQFSKIEAEFRNAGATVDALSLNDWIDRRDQICANLTDDDLFFIDQDFSSEEGGNNASGEEILSYLLQRPQQRFVCIFFTHAIGVADVAKARKEIAERIGAPTKQHRFAVVSKESLTAEDGGGYDALRIAFKEAFLKDWCLSIASDSAIAITAALSEASATLLTLNVDELAAAFFRKAFKDGTLEPEVLLRVFFLVARVKLQDQRTNELTLWKRLSNIRRLLAETAGDKLQTPTNAALQKWREREVFDPGDVINRTLSPIFLGDVFAVERGTKKEYYVLIAQPCDLIIRDTGLRNNSEALFLKVSTKPPKNESFAYEFEFPNLGKQWILYSGAIPVNLNLLDIISFRPDGRLLFDGEISTSELMLPGVLKKLEQLKGTFAGLFDSLGKRTEVVLSSKYPRLSLAPFAGGDEPLKDNRIELPITRVGRIRSPRAEAILSGFAIHHTREAFDYNFADLAAFVDKPTDAASPAIPGSGGSEHLQPS